MTLLCAALLIGIAAGLRAMSAPAITSWAIVLNCIGPVHGWPSFMGDEWTPWLFTVAAIAEAVADKLPNTPSRKVSLQFCARLVVGGLCGATFGATATWTDAWIGAAVWGALGALIGTLYGAHYRARLARALRSDRPAAFLEDAVTLILAAAAVAIA